MRETGLWEKKRERMIYLVFECVEQHEKCHYSIVEKIVCNWRSISKVVDQQQVYLHDTMTWSRLNNLNKRERERKCKRAIDESIFLSLSFLAMSLSVLLLIRLDLFLFAENRRFLSTQTHIHTHSLSL